MHRGGGKHGNFQMIYYGHHVSAYPHKRNGYKDHPYFHDCTAFLKRWDQASFDPNYDIKPFEFSTNLVHSVFARTLYDLMVICSERASLIGTCRDKS